MAEVPKNRQGQDLPPKRCCKCGCPARKPCSRTVSRLRRLQRVQYVWMSPGGLVATGLLAAAFALARGAVIVYGWLEFLLPILAAALVAGVTAAWSEARRRLRE